MVVNETRDVGALIGRILLALIFVLSGFGKILQFSGTEQMMAARGIPASEALLVLSILIELGGGLLIVAGFQARWAALVIFLFLIPVTYVFHVQGYQEAMHQRQLMMVMMQRINILKNMSIEGGLLLLASFGPGRFSVDEWI
ncbi:MAG: DoxX family protein [Candidatus Binataceae bacterium]|jgi:putative oxidoreductase